MGGQEGLVLPFANGLDEGHDEALGLIGFVGLDKRVSLFVKFLVH